MPDTSNEPSATPDLTGRTLGDFLVLRKLGAGGMGQVYLARQLSLKREVALKFLRTDLLNNATALKRFEAEAQAVARLTHPGIVQVYQFGEHDGVRFMVLEYVEGRNLRDYMARRGIPELPVVMSVLKQVAAALQKAHEHGIVHRDIKPENILVTRKVEVKVTDFGLSRFFAHGEALNITQSGVTVGTPLYLSPEQAQGQIVDHRSDIYSFGVSAYHLLSGEPPFKGTTAVEVALKHVTEQPRCLAELCPDLPADLCAMVHKMMAKLPADRYQSAREILRDLAKIREGMSLGITQAVTLTTSDPAASATSGTTVLALTQSQGAMPTAPVRWARWVAVALACGLAALAGVLVHAMINPLVSPLPPSGAPSNAIPQPGLPEVRLDERLITLRERELLTLLKDRDTRSDRIIDGYIELGLLYVRERRLAEARQAFEKLAEQNLDGPFSLQTLTAERVGKLGVAIVLAEQDKADDSVKHFDAALKLPLPKLLPKEGRDPLRVMQTILLQHPDLAQAVSNALNRDVANGSKLNASLEALRSPRGISRKE